MIHILPLLLSGATARLMRRGEAYVRFPLNCHTPHIGPDYGTLAQFSAGIVILSEDLRYAQIIRERPGLWWNIAALPRFST